MDTKAFTEEAKRLARPCVRYARSGPSAPDAYWHGDLQGLWTSIRRGEDWLNVQLNSDCIGGSVELSARPATSVTPLFAQSDISLPPVDAIFYLGSDAVGDYLLKHDWPRNEPLNGNFPDPVPGEYEKNAWKGNCPVFRQDETLVTGGWHMPWPDGDWYDYIDAELVAWTLRDAEPWVEIFKRGDEYIVKQRCT